MVKKCFRRHELGKTTYKELTHFYLLSHFDVVIE